MIGCRVREIPLAVGRRRTRLTAQALEVAAATTGSYANYCKTFKGDNVMKIAVSSSGQDLNAQLDPRFGRCSYFLIIDTDDMSFEVFANENAALGGGAGIQSAQFVASKGVKAVITGNCGPNAMQVFSAAEVQVYVGQTGTIKDVIERYKNGELTAATQANAPLHSGTGGRGMGRGRGMGAGGGRGGRGGTGGGQGK
jgi:predicted Fe-Mo cluster-binding NifX family protein